MATPKELLMALQKRCANVTAAASNLTRLVGNAMLIVGHPRLTIDETERAALLEDYSSLRAKVVELWKLIPADLADFEPDPSEYENEI